jgi:hypothetical protein
MPIKRSWDEIDPGKFLRAGDLPLGKRYVVILADINEREIGWPKEKKTVLTLDHADGTPWADYVPNKTARGVLRDKFGPDPNAVIGKRLVLRTESTDLEGRPGIKIEPAPEPAPGLDDEIPF